MNDLTAGKITKAFTLEDFEYAAEAAGILSSLGKWVDDKRGRPGFLCGRLSTGNSVWNPRDDDGDSQRLAVVLNISVSYDDSRQSVTSSVWCKGANCYAYRISYTEYWNLTTSKYKALRLAVFRTAIDVGKSLKRLLVNN